MTELVEDAGMRTGVEGVTTATSEARIEEPRRELTRGEKLRAQRHAGRSHGRDDEDRKEHRERHERRHDHSERRHRHRSRDRSRDRTVDEGRERDRERERDPDERDKKHRHRSRHHESRHRDKRHDHDDTQLVLFDKPESGQSKAPATTTSTSLRDGVLRDPKNDQDDALFSVDARGDSLVWQYGTNDARHVPSYHRLAYGRRVLGTPKRFVFNHEGAGGAKTMFSVDPGHESLGSVFREKSNVALLRQLYGSAAPKKAKHTSGDAAFGEEDEFISLSPKKKRKRGGSESGSDSQISNGSGDDDSSESGSDVSAILPDAPDNEDNTDLGHIYIVEGDEAREKLKQKLAELSRHVKSDSQDVDAWLELVELQDQQVLLLGNDDSTDYPALDSNAKSTTQSGDQVKGLAAAKLAILESALQQVRSEAGRERLQLAIMREGAKTWTPKQLAERWTDLARNMTVSPSTGFRGLTFALWRARLDYEMTNLSTATVDKIKGFMVRRLRTLENKAATERDESRLIGLYSEMAYVFLRATRFLYDAGFRDLATAAWQATLESFFARPTPPAASLGQFWDSELPRIGEDGAQGWRDYAAKLVAGEDVEEALLDYDVKKQTLPTLDLAAITSQAQGGNEDFYENDMAEHLPLYEAWAAAERQRGVLAKLPGRVIDDVDDGGYEDVFRVVVFSDMEQLLFASAIPGSILHAIRPFIADAFLLFCQLPPAFGTSTWIDTARSDPFLAIVVLPVDDDYRHTTNGTGESTQTGRAPPDLCYDGSQVALTSDMLFAVPGWFQYLPDWLRPSPSSAETAPVPPQWVASTLRQLVQTFGFGGLATYSLAVDTCVNPAGVKKAARSLIKQYVSNTSLYESYALAEASRGNTEIARGVFTSAAGAVGGPAGTIDTELSFRQAWAWMELEDGQYSAAIQRLMLQSLSETPNTHATDDSLSPAELLRLRQALQTGMDYNLSTRLIRRAALFAQSFVLLEYLADDYFRGVESEKSEKSRHGNLGAALAAAASFSCELQARDYADAPEHERFLQSTVARIVYYHARHSGSGLGTGGGRSFRPAELQAPVRSMVEQFPQNGVFLRLFAWLDPVSAFVQLRDPVREVVETIVTDKKNDCVSGRVFAIKQTLRRSHAQSGYAATRAAFDRALGTDEATAHRGSSRLWQAYVRLTLKEAVAASQSLRGSKRHRRRVDKRMAAVAKDVFYRAVRACPASKEVLLEVFGRGSTGTTPATNAEKEPVSAPEAAGMSPSDLRAVFQTLVGKGLRVHIDLGEVLERV
ncbi:hypothetical protein F503_03062 [Ophiostoma piceae UAMH 11346]|uniref:DUF1740-domain-containing protein n=1 Tax=Ophiostoma piceae (strain UAMH 11346) TaxID=1262450 RepID=S3CIN8_OPHP1|nr:hypothetical protein F503_03062 [Ophiostoma piceae UAMH 11346]